MGSVFARGFLRPGHPVYPLVRDSKMDELARQHAEPKLVVIAVAETDIQTVLQETPGCWRYRLVLLQNELLPDDWKKHNLEPCVISVWFEKKKGMDSKVIIPSTVFGKHALKQADEHGLDLPGLKKIATRALLSHIYVIPAEAGIQ